MKQQNNLMDFALMSCIWTLVLAITVSCEDLPPLSCPDTAKRDLTDISAIFNCKPVYNPEDGCVKCHGLIEGILVFTIDARFAIMQEVPEYAKNDTDVFVRCVGLEKYTLKTNGDYMFPWNTAITYSIDFNSSMAVGILTADQRLWKTNRSCNISILSDILQLNIFFNQSIAFYRSFWNFSSPFYSVKLNWFHGLSVHCGESCIEPMWLVSLQNTSLRLLNVTYMWNKYGYDNDTVLIKDMPLLTKLVLQGNDISSFHEDSFMGTPAMESLTVHQSRLTAIPTTLERIPQLRVLKISRSLEVSNFTISTQILSRFKFLESLDLSDNYIFSVSKKLPPLPKLKELSLKNCRITTIEHVDLINVLQLQELDLSQNSLTLLKENTFLELKNLNLLDLSQNSLTNWPVIYDVSLRILNLSQNALRNVSNLGDTLTTVEFLNISRNKIEEWQDKNVFTFHRPDRFPSYRNRSVRKAPNNNFWVQNVDLSNNFIVGFSEIMLESVNGLQRLDLGGNHFDCVDCRMIPFQKWLNESSTNITNLGTSDPLLCASPINNKGYPVSVVQFDEKPCLKPRQQSPWITLGISLGVLFIVIATFIGGIYNYRSQLTYMLHLYKIRKRAKNFSQTTYDKYAFDAFISYSSHDRRFVLNHLAPFLEKGEERYTLCLHERDFPLGSHIVDNIVGSIQHSRKAIIVLSDHFIKSKWCNWELEMVNHKTFNDDEHFLILLQLETLQRNKIPRHLQYLMDTRTYLEWPSPGHGSEEQVRQRLKKALGQSLFQKTNEVPPSLSDVMERY